MEDGIKKEVEEFVRAIMHWQYCENDIKSILSVFEPEVSWIGPGETDRQAGLEAVSAYFRNFSGAVPKCHIWDEDYSVEQVGDGLYLCYGQMWIATDIKTKLLLKVRQRVSFLIRKRDGVLKCLHLHCSNPYQEIMEGDIFPRQVGRATYDYMEEKLQEMETRLLSKDREIEELTANMLIGVGKSTLNGHIVFLSESALEILGYTREEASQFFATPFATELVWEEDLPVFFDMINQLKSNVHKSVSCEVRARAKGGNPIWVVFSAKIVEEGGQQLIYSFISDITRIKTAEIASRQTVDTLEKANEALAQKNHQIQVMLNAIQGGLKISRDDEVYSYEYVSDELCAMFGYTREEYLEAKKGSAVGAVYPPDLPRVLKECQEAFANGSLDYAIKYRVSCKDGTLKWIIDSGKKTINDAGETIINSIYLDVTEVEKANQKIAEQKEQLNSIYSSIMCGILRYPVKEDFSAVSMNHEAQRILGYQSEEECAALGKVEFYNRIHPDDREQFLQQIQALKEQGQRYSSEFRILTPEGQLTWVYSTSELILDVNGCIIIQRVMIDITDKKKLELALEEERQRFRIAVESTPSIIFEYDLELDQYSAYGTLEIGVKKHEIEKVVPDFLTGQASHMVKREFLEQFQNMLLGRSGNEMELVMALSPDSREFVWARVTVTPLYDGQQKLIKMIGRISNIQSEKETEFALKEAQSRDGLTGLYTRDAGIRMVKEFMEQKEPGLICGMMLLDMDNFQHINEVEGSVFADAILQEVAIILRSETTPEDILIRLGGDEFMVFKKDCAKKDAIVLGPKIARMVGNLFAKKDRNIKISVSIGMCVTEVVDEYSGLYRCAESTLKYVKQNARGTAACYLDTSNELGTVLTQLYTEKHFINEISRPTDRKEEDLTSFALELLGKAHNLDDAISLLLARIGKSYQLDRVSVLEVDAEYLSYRFTYQWARQSANIELDKDFYVSLEELKRASDMYDEDGLCTFNLKDGISALPSCLHAGIWNHGDYAGSLSFESSKVDYVWTKEHKRLIKELVKIIFSFVMKARADAVSQAKTDFLSRMSHEIRTPMNAISGMTTIAKSLLDDKEKAIDCLNKIESANNYLLNLINDILDMSRIESGKIDMNIENMDLERLIEELTGLMRPQAEDKNIRLFVENSYTGNSILQGDTLRLNQVLVNIIGNAVKFTEPGGEIYFSIQKAAEEKGRVSIRFSVKDTGIGMSQEAAGRIFYAFEQAGKNTASQYGGTGLGLSISSRLVQMMGGVLEVKSELGKGSEFYFTLPFSYGNKEYQKEETSDSGEEAVYDFAGKRVLLAEDNELNREIAETILEMNGFIVESAVDGRDALECFMKHEPYYYDVVLMDIRMPVMDGLEATKRIRTSSKADARSIPVIAMTANAFDEDTKKSMDSGMDGHLSKPIEIGKLLKMLYGCLK